MRRFDRELAEGWNYEEDLLSDHPFGAYYHWSALLCGLSQAALDGLLAPGQLEPIRDDIETCLPGLRASQQILVAIPSTLEAHPWVMHLMLDGHLARLRRIHARFGEALHEERVLREVDTLDP